MFDDQTNHIKEDNHVTKDKSLGRVVATIIFCYNMSNKKVKVFYAFKYNSIFDVIGWESIRVGKSKWIYSSNRCINGSSRRGLLSTKKDVNGASKIQG